MGRFLPQKRMGFGLYIVLGVVFVTLLLYLLKLFEPTSPPKNVQISNISDHQATISWITDKPTRGQVIISEDGNFPVLPVFADTIYWDDGEKKSKVQRFYTTHLVTVDKLDPNKSYSYLIYQDWKKVSGGEFKMAGTLSSISAPNPVYGRVLDADQKPVVGALVYFWVTTSREISSLLSALTNSDGGWSVDLGNLRTKDLKFTFPVSSKSAERVIVETGLKGPVQASVSAGQDKPWPNIILR